MRRVRGFTLIELLVVIAIIAIVAAILFPVFSSARRNSWRTETLSNVAQIGKAIQMYLTDYDETLPFRFPMLPKWDGYNTVLFISSPGGFNDIYAPYLKDNSVWLCREDRLRKPGYTSFVVNEQLAFAWAYASISRPAEAIYLTDRRDVELPNAPVDTYVWWEFINERPFTEERLPGKLDPIAVASQISPIRYVGNLGMYLFMDGHVKAMPFEQTWGSASTNLHLATKP